MRRNSPPFLMAFVVLTFIGVASPTAAQNMRVADVPLIEGATDVSSMKRRGDVRYDVGSDFKSVGNFYAKKLAEQGWSKSSKDNLQSSFWVQTFSKGQMSLVVRVANRDGNSEVRLTPTGMVWEEDGQPRPKGQPTSKGQSISKNQATPKDIPLPEDVTELEYSDFFETIEFKSPSTVATIAKFLSDALEQRNWVQAARDFDSESFVRLNFTQNQSSLKIDIRKQDVGCEITMRTEGLQWDGMKVEIERAKKEAERVAAELKKKHEAAAMANSRAQRQNRPKQGIDKLPKLPSKATVIVDGKTFNLSEFVAFEYYEYGEWTTRIVATQKAIKQGALLSRLAKIANDRDDNAAEQDISQTWPDTHLEIVLDKDDRPYRMIVRAGGAAGIASSDELTGTALVEDARARGSVAMTEPDSFFDKVYTAKISFDVPVLSTESPATKRIADAPKLANAGKLTMGNKTYNLNHVVAYDMMFFDDPMTTIVLSEQSLDIAKLTAALGKKAADAYFEFTPQVRLTVDADDNLRSLSIWADNISIGGNDSLDDDIVIEDGRARGTARMTEPGDFRGKKYSFELSFDVTVLGKKAPTRRKSVGGLAADSHDGLPVPEGHDGIQSQGSPLRTQSSLTVAAELKAVVKFYRDEFSSGDWGQWNEDPKAAQLEGDTAKLSFAGPKGSLIVQLKAAGTNTSITLVMRDAAKAKAAGLFPASGKARLFIANESTKEVVININKRDYKIAAGAGAKNPKTGINWEVVPGNYTIEIKLASGQTQSEKLKIGPDETMGVIVNGSGGFDAIELY